MRTEQRFWSKVDTSGDCWEWTASRSPLGYGQYAIQRKPRGAHRVAWEMLVGEIPDGFELDHLCRNRACVNPDHMQVVSHRENTLRGHGPSATNARKTKCCNGHDFDETNTYITPKGARQCRACVREAGRRYRLKQKALNGSL